MLLKFFGATLIQTIIFNHFKWFVKLHFHHWEFWKWEAVEQILLLLCQPASSSQTTTWLLYRIDKTCISDMCTGFSSGKMKQGGPPRCSFDLGCYQSIKKCFFNSAHSNFPFFFFLLLHLQMKAWEISFQYENKFVAPALLWKSCIPKQNSLSTTLHFSTLFPENISGTGSDVLWLPVGCGNMALFALNQWIELGKQDKTPYICDLLESVHWFYLLCSRMRRRGGKEDQEDRWPQSGDGGCGRPPIDRGPFTAASHL